MHLITNHKFLWSQLQNVCKILERLVSWVDDFKGISTHKRSLLNVCIPTILNPVSMLLHLHWLYNTQCRKKLVLALEYILKERQILWHLNDISWTSLWPVWCQSTWLDALLYIPLKCIMYRNENVDCRLSFQSFSSTSCAGIASFKCQSAGEGKDKIPGAFMLALSWAASMCLNYS